MTCLKEAEEEPSVLETGMESSPMGVDYDKPLV